MDLSVYDILVDAPHPTKTFGTREPLLKEYQETVRQTTSSSAPGPRDVPYKVFKNCPLLFKRLWKSHFEKEDGISVEMC